MMKMEVNEYLDKRFSASYRTALLANIRKSTTILVGKLRGRELEVDLENRLNEWFPEVLCHVFVIGDCLYVEVRNHDVWCEESFRAAAPSLAR
jgi:hypothetical protein